MPQLKESLLEACQILAEQEQLMVTVKASAKGAIIAGVGCFTGGLFGGPIGLAIGGTVGSAAAALVTMGTYRSVSDILRNDLSPAQKQKLVNSIKMLVIKIDAENVKTIVALISSKSSLKSAVIREIKNFLLKEKKMKVVSR